MLRLFSESQDRTSRRNTGISPLLITDHEIFRLTWVLLSHDEPRSLPVAPVSTRALPEEMCVIVQGLVHTAWDTKVTVTKAKY